MPSSAFPASGGLAWLYLGILKVDIKIILKAIYPLKI
jgi:hypothetical protein